MRRGLRGLLIVLGVLCVAASADALTIWSGGTSPEFRSFRGEDDGGVQVGPLDDSTLTNRDRVRAGGDSRFGRRSFVPYSYSRLAPPPLPGAGGNPRFGRRDFIWHPSPVIPLDYFSTERPSRTLPGFWRRYIPSGRLPGTIGRIPGLGGNVLRYPYVPGPGLHLAVDRDGRIISLPLPEQESSFRGRLEFRSDRFSSSPEDFYGASSAAVVNIALVPEPGTAALLLVGLCALAARRRRC